MCLAHLHPKANICATFHENWWKTEEVVRDARFFPNFCNNMPFWWKTEEVVRDARFFPHFCHNMPLPWQHTFYHCQHMCLAHLHPKALTSVPNFMRIGEKLSQPRLRNARFFPNFCNNMPLPWQHTFYHFQKMCLAHLHPKANICAKFHENWWKTEEVVRDARYFPNFCHNMPLPWQHTFYHCQKMCLAHLHPKAILCSITLFMSRLVKNWGSSSRRKIFPPFLP